jgi:hypothetical protein
VKCLLELAFLEVRPEDVRKMEFRVCALPEEKVAEPLFTGCSDEEIG